jgi:hypothetical protein
MAEAISRVAGCSNGPVPEWADLHRLSRAGR